MMRKNIVVTGGAGYIGSFMVRRLQANGYTPIVIDDQSTGNRRSLPDGVRLIQGDFSDPARLDAAMGGAPVLAVMHFAARIMVGESVLRPDMYYSTNVAKVVGLLDAMVRHKVGIFIMSSSSAVYGEPQYLPIDEEHPMNAINPYGRSKAMAERIARDYCAAFGIKSVALRYFNAAGAAADGSCGESQAVKQNLIQIVLDNIEKSRPTGVFGNDWKTADGTCIRDYIHVEDIVAAHLLALEYAASTSSPQCGAFNLGTGKGTSVLEVIKAVEKAAGKKVDYKIEARRPGDPEQLVASNLRAMEILGWNPSYPDIETIVETAYRWHFNRKY